MPRKNSEMSGAKRGKISSKTQEGERQQKNEWGLTVLTCAGTNLYFETQLNAERALL